MRETPFASVDPRDAPPRQGVDASARTVESAGGDALDLLLDDARRVVAFDPSPRQVHLLELTIAAFRALEHADLLAFLGARESGRRLVLYAEVRRFLAPESRDFWDARRATVAGGAIDVGRRERALARARGRLRRVLGKTALDEMARAVDPAARLDVFRRRWDGIRWRLVTRGFLSRRPMARMTQEALSTGRDAHPPFPPSVAVLRGALERALVERSAHDEPFVARLLLGRYDEPNALPRYLRPESFATIRARLDRVEARLGRVPRARRPLAALSFALVRAVRAVRARAGCTA